MNYSEAWPGGPKFLLSSAPLITTDTMLLADFVRPRRAALCGDIGTGSGALILLLAAKLPHTEFLGFELMPEAAQTARANLELNGLAERSEIISGDAAETCRRFNGGSFDMLVSNPPYFTPGSTPSPDASRDAARRGLDLAELCKIAAYLLKNGGTFSLVYRAERLAELFISMSAGGIEPKRLRFFAKNASSAPILALVEGRRGAKPGIIVGPTLLQKNHDGSETDDFRRFNRR